MIERIQNLFRYSPSLSVSPVKSSSTSSIISQCKSMISNWWDSLSCGDIKRACNNITVVSPTDSLATRVEMVASPTFSGNASKQSPPVASPVTPIPVAFTEAPILVAPPVASPVAVIPVAPPVAVSRDLGPLSSMLSEIPKDQRYVVAHAITQDYVKGMEAHKRPSYISLSSISVSGTSDDVGITNISGATINHWEAITSEQRSDPSRILQTHRETTFELGEILYELYTGHPPCSINSQEDGRENNHIYRIDKNIAVEELKKCDYLTQEQKNSILKMLLITEAPEQPQSVKQLNAIEPLTLPEIAKAFPDKAVLPIPQGAASLRDQQRHIPKNQKIVVAHAITRDYAEGMKAQKKLFSHIDPSRIAISGQCDQSGTVNVSDAKINCWTGPTIKRLRNVEEISQRESTFELGTVLYTLYVGYPPPNLHRDLNEIAYPEDRASASEALRACKEITQEQKNIILRMILLSDSSVQPNPDAIAQAFATVAPTG